MAECLASADAAEVPRIPLNNGGYALVDARDLSLVLADSYRWRRTADGYVVSGSNARPVYMHRLIARTPAGLDTDHVNGNRHDNRRSNLRTATRTQNNAGARRRLSQTGFRGVYWNHGRFRAQITVEGVRHHLGTFDTAPEAARAYDAAARRWFGDFARLNFPRAGERRATGRVKDAGAP